MPDLTLEQVKQADRLAIGAVDDCAGYVYLPGGQMVWFRLWDLDQDFEPAIDDGGDVERWFHVKGCDCEFCAK
ncbi:MAG TPA: hypothetical protein VIK32_12355 [Candidatus Limnocylindrales bacterium]